jgi:acetyltransferase-like isoleucine patch superfamily enzyme
MIREEKIENFRTLEQLSAPDKSQLRKYQDLVIGRRGLATLLKYELIVTVCSWVPGALGLLLRKKLYPLLLGRVGRGVNFGMNVVFRHPHKIWLGDYVTIDDNCVLDARGTDNRGIALGSTVFIGRNSSLVCKDGNIEIGDNVSLGISSYIFSANIVQVGRGGRVASYSILNGGTHAIKRTDIPFWQQERIGKGIILEDNVWLGTNTKVLDGVRIGNDAVVGAGAVVTADIPPFSLALGVPAKVIQDRRSGERSVESTLLAAHSDGG